MILKDLESESIPKSVSELSVVLTDDSEIAELNESYRGKQGPTDVLSFSQLEGEGAASTTLGDLVISVETAKRQAEEFGVSLHDELNRLMVHGVLHLFGYDHENVSDEEVLRMQTREAEILSLF